MQMAYYLDTVPSDLLRLLLIYVVQFRYPVPPFFFTVVTQYQFTGNGFRRWEDFFFIPEKVVIFRNTQYGYPVCETQIVSVARPKWRFYGLIEDFK